MALTERLQILITGDSTSAEKAFHRTDAAAGSLDSAAGSAKKAGGSFMAVGTQAAAAGTLVAAGLYSAASSASALEQQVKTSERVFGDASGSISSFGRTAADSLGMSEEAFRLNANRLGAMVTNLGFSNDEAAQLSIRFSGVAADLAAAFGTDTTQAIEAIGAAFRGERDPIEQFGISLKQADIDARVASLGLDTSTTAAKKHSEAVATIALIQEQASKTAGTFAKSLDTTAGATKRLGAEAEDAKAKLGKALDPIVAKGANWAAGVLDEFTTLMSKAEDGQRAIEDVVKSNKKWGESYDEAGAYMKRVQDQIVSLRGDAGRLRTEFAVGDLSDAEAGQMEALARRLQLTTALMDGQREAARQLSAQHGISYEAAWKVVSGQQDLAGATKDATDEARDQAGELKTVAQRFDEARSAMKDYFDGITGNKDAEADYFESGEDLLKQLGEKGAGFDWVRGQINLNTEAGRENRRVSKEWIADAEEFARAEYQKTGSLEAGRAKLEQARDWFIRAQVAAGMSATAAKAYADELGLVPSKIETTWVANGLSELELRAQRLRDLMTGFLSGNWGGGGFLTGGYQAPVAPSAAAGAAAAGAAAGAGAVRRSADGAPATFIIQMDGTQIAKGIAQREAAYS